ncbi:MAG: hypothetical protein R3B09_03730 [Nannocystaceae bacterium]
MPFYLWVVLGLGLGGADTGAAMKANLAVATAVALGITYVHRHYTFILVYGDQGTFSRRRRAFIVAPFVALGVIAALRGLNHLGVRMEAFPTVNPWAVALVAVGAWNIWHTIMQRYGILRVYAGRAGGGLQAHEHARRDLALLWSSVALVATMAIVFRPETFLAVGNGRKTIAVAEWLLGGGGRWALVASVAAVVGVVAVRWVRHELRAPLAWTIRRPRLLFLTSTLALLAIFVIHGPIVGYLCFGVAHALEYVAFVHHFGERKFGGDPANVGLVARWMRRPWIFGPLISLVLVAAFLVLFDSRKTDAFLIYYTATSTLHFLYDGWIWKVRTPAVARPLGVTS